MGKAKAQGGNRSAAAAAMTRAGSAYRSSNLAKHTHPSRIYRYLNRRFANALVRLLAPARPRAVLEAGCGEGFLLHKLGQQEDCRLTGCDLSLEAIRYARGQCSPDVRLLVADVNRLPFAGRTFDAVVCSEVLEHLPQVDGAMLELGRVARRHVLITVPREPYFRILAGLVMRLGLGDDPGHMQFWSGRGFRRLIGSRFVEARITASTIYRLALGSLAPR